MTSWRFQFQFKSSLLLGKSTTVAFCFDLCLVWAHIQTCFYAHQSILRPNTVQTMSWEHQEVRTISNFSSWLHISQERTCLSICYVCSQHFRTSMLCTGQFPPGAVSHFATTDQASGPASHGIHHWYRQFSIGWLCCFSVLSTCTVVLLTLFEGSLVNVSGSFKAGARLKMLCWVLGY